MNNSLPKKDTKTLEFGVIVSSIFKEIVENTQEGWGLKIALQETMRLLARVAKRAIELDDEQLNKLMLLLGLYSIVNPESPDWNLVSVQQYMDYGKGEIPIVEGVKTT